MAEKMLELRQTSNFKKDLRRMIKRGANMELLDEVIQILLKRETLPENTMIILSPQLAGLS